MKKLVASLSLVAAALFTSGCETATQLGSMSQAGMTALSCDQVYAPLTRIKPIRTQPTRGLNCSRPLALRQTLKR